MLEQLTAERFEGLVGRDFQATTESGASLGVTLIEVTRLERSARSDRSDRSPFSIVFRGPLDCVIDQGIHHFDNSELGALDIFIVPIGSDEHGMRYEAVFS